MKSIQNHFWRDSRMPYVETRRACMSRICYQAHSHPTFSIGAVDQGQSRFHSHPTGQHIITAKTLVLMPAHVVHSCNPMPEQLWSYQMMHIDAAWLNTLLQEHQIEYPHLVEHCLVKQQPQVLYDVVLHQMFTALNQALFDPTINIIKKEQLLIETLSQLLLPHLPPAQHVSIRDEQQQLQQLIDWLAPQADFISLQDMATRLGISRFSLIRLFNHQFGLAPHAYQINLKINQARQLLRSGHGLADIAFRLGFCDQSHFHRCFKAHTGITPKQYQQSI